MHSSSTDNQEVVDATLIDSVVSEDKDDDDNEELSQETVKASNVPKPDESRAKASSPDDPKQKRYKQTVIPRETARTIKKTPIGRRNPDREVKTLSSTLNTPIKKRVVGGKPRGLLKKPPQIRWQDYIDDNKFGFRNKKPIGSTAIDLTDFTVGDEGRPPVLDDVLNLNINTDFEPEQQDISKAYKHFKLILEVPSSDAHNKILEKLGSDSEKLTVKQEQEEKLKTVKVAACSIFRK